MGVSIATDDTLITSQIVAARRYVEQVTGRQLITATWRLTLESFPKEIQLPYPPYSSTTSLVYIASDGTSTTLSTSAYEIDTDAEPIRVRPAWGYTWPGIRGVYGAVKYTYVAGYGAAGSSVPADIVAAVKAIAATLYEFRESTITSSNIAAVESVSEYLLWPYRVLTF